MFSAYHIAWMVISVLVIAFTLRYLLKNKVPLNKLLWFAFYAGIVVELIKVFSLVQMVPNIDKTMYFPYIETQHIPLNVCSLQKFFIIYVLFTKNKQGRENVLAFMYPTGLIGALIALVVPAGATIEWTLLGAFTNPQAYQFFLYHALLVIIGAYIPLSGELQIQKKHFVSSIAMLLVLAIGSMYLNSGFATATYEAEKVVRVDYTPNYLFTYKPPISSIKLTEVWHWYLYVLVLTVLALSVIFALYMPFIKQEETVKVKEKAPENA